MVEKMNSKMATILAALEVDTKNKRIADGNVAKEKAAGGNDVGNKDAGNEESPPICAAVNVAQGSRVAHRMISSKCKIDSTSPPPTLQNREAQMAAI